MGFVLLLIELEGSVTHDFSRFQRSGWVLSKKRVAQAHCSVDIGVQKIGPSGRLRSYVALKL